MDTVDSLDRSMLRLGRLFLRNTDPLLAPASPSSISPMLKLVEPLNLFAFFPRNSDRRPWCMSMKLWPARWRKSWEDRRDEMSKAAMLAGMTDMVEAVDVAVLLLERRLKTEARFPGLLAACRLGDDRSA